MVQPLDPASARKGISGIVAGMIFFGIIFSVLFTYNNVVLDTNQTVNEALDARISKDIAQQNEDFTIRTRNVTQNMIGFLVDNNGHEVINVVSAFVYEPSGAIADQSDGSKAVFSGSPLFFVRAGANSSAFNTTVAYTGGNYTVTVLTDKGNVQSAHYPAILITASEVGGYAEAIEGVTTAAIGKLLMNFTSLQFCIPATENCEPSSSDWRRGWNVDTGDNHLFRIEVKNTASASYFLSNSTVIVSIGEFSGAASLGNTVFFIKKPPTVADDDGLAYTPDFAISIPGESVAAIYFGATTPGGDALSSFTNNGIYVVVLALFAYEDVNDNGTYEPSIDTIPYGQSLPFQGILVN